MSHRRGDGHSRGFGFGGFQIGERSKRNSSNSSQETYSLSAMPPPSTMNKHGYAGLQTINQNALDATYEISRKRPKTEEEYFEDDDDDGHQNGNKLAYIPAPGSPSWDGQAGSNQNGSDSEEDPLDAFMAGLEQQVEKEKKVVSVRTKKKDVIKGIRDDIENEDDEESYYRYIEENPNLGAEKDESDVELEYDEDGNPIAPERSKFIDPLPSIDHSEIEYATFEKNFYEEHEEIARLADSEIEALRQKLGIKVSGPAPPKPVSSFAHFGFDDKLIKAICKSEYVQPTPIQAQGIPAVLGGRDVIGIAKTGSGKTAAFLWPMLTHVMDQKELEFGDGPIGLILAPTRELAQQIYVEAKRFGKVYGINVACCFGGGGKWEQAKALQEGAEIVVATPGRIIDLIKDKATNLKRVTLLVLDEADRMFDLGFEPQVRSICNHVRPDRQTLVFSATFKRKIERLVRDVLTDPVRIIQGELGEANEDVTQICLVLPNGPSKWAWLTSKLVELTSSGSVLIFVTKKLNSEELASNLQSQDFKVGLLHGDVGQNERSKVILSFKKKEVPILVATDVAARGLDIPHIKTVINYDIARDIDTHTHRVGRTGRAGEKGIAYTLVTDKDKEFAGHLVRNLEGANQPVPKALMNLALQSAWFRKSRFRQGKGKRIGRDGLGFRERPGLGAGSMFSGSSLMKDSTLASVSQTAQNISKNCGPQTDRFSAMKTAFQSQYKTQFTAATDTAWKTMVKPNKSGAANASTSSKKEKRKSRWDTAT